MKTNVCWLVGWSVGWSYSVQPKLHILVTKAGYEQDRDARITVPFSKKINIFFCFDMVSIVLSCFFYCSIIFLLFYICGTKENMIEQQKLCQKFILCYRGCLSSDRLHRTTDLNEFRSIKMNLGAKKGLFQAFIGNSLIKSARIENDVE